MTEMLIERCALSSPQNHIARDSDGSHNRFYETIGKGNVEHMIIRR